MRAVYITEVAGLWEDGEKKMLNIAIFFLKFLAHSCLSRPFVCCSFLSVCLLVCYRVHLILQCSVFGVSFLMLFSLISSEVFALKTEWGIHGNKLHRDYHSMFRNVCVGFFFCLVAGVFSPPRHPAEGNVRMWSHVAIECNS